MSDKKPWEETWRGASAYVEDVDTGRLRAKIGDGCGERVALISAAPDMARELMDAVRSFRQGYRITEAQIRGMEKALTKAGVIP